MLLVGHERSTAAEMWPRAVDGPALGLLQGFSFQASKTAVSNEMQFEAARSIRTSIVVLASLNAVAAVASALGIWCDCYVGARRSHPRPSSLLKAIGPAETFPIILSLGTVIQAIIFAVAQSTGLQALLVLGCTAASQAMLPALFMVPLIQLVFGMDMTAQALRRKPFAERPRRTVLICLGIVCASLIVTSAVTQFATPPNFCFADLMWLVQRWRMGCFGLLTAITAALVLGIVVISVRLYRPSGASATQRTAALWTACYMMLAVVTLATMLPFFGALSTSVDSMVAPYEMQLSTAAAVGANLTGFTTGGLYILLRWTGLGSTSRRGYLEFDISKPKQETPSLARSSSIYTKQMERPVSPPMRTEGTDRVAEVKHEEALVGRAKPNTRSINLKMPPARCIPSQAAAPEVVVVAATPKPGLRKDSAYSIFPSMPGVRNGKATARPDGIRGDVLLAPPPAVWMPSRPRRSSLGSSATVQIGLRVSNINDMPPITSSLFDGSSARGEPVNSGILGLAITTDASPFDMYAVADDESLYEDDLIDDDNDDDTAKQPAAVPRAVIKTDNNKHDSAKATDSGIKLSPTVYSPEPPSRGTGKANGGSPGGAPSTSQGSEGQRPRAKPAGWI